MIMIKIMLIMIKIMLIMIIMKMKMIMIIMIPCSLWRGWMSRKRRAAGLIEGPHTSGK